MRIGSFLPQASRTATPAAASHRSRNNCHWGVAKVATTTLTIGSALAGLVTPAAAILPPRCPPGTRMRPVQPVQVTVDARHLVWYADNQIPMEANKMPIKNTAANNCAIEYQDFCAPQKAVCLAMNYQSFVRYPRTVFIQYGGTLGCCENV